MGLYAASILLLGTILVTQVAAGRVLSSNQPVDPVIKGFLEFPNCVYSVYIRTGNILKGGTDSNIGVQFFDSYNNSVTIDNLVPWGGLMPQDHDYYERGNLDIFSGVADCLTTPVCKLVITSDGTGPHHGWYVNYLEVTSTGPHIPCAQHLFTLEQWLARDAYPYELTAVRDSCVYYDGLGSQAAHESAVQPSHQ